MRDEDAIKERLAYWKASLAGVKEHIGTLEKSLPGFYENKKSKTGHIYDMESMKEVRRICREVMDKWEMESIIVRLIEELEWILGDGNKG